MDNGYYGSGNPFDGGQEFQGNGYGGDFDFSNVRPVDNYLYNMDESLMLKLGFLPEELCIVQQCVDIFGTCTNGKLTSPPFMICDMKTVGIVMYAYKICIGKEIVDTEDPISLSKHYKKLYKINGGNQTFNCMYIRHRNIQRIPRVAVVAGMPSGNFEVLNSSNYDKMEATYKVIKIAQEWVTIESTKRMAVGHDDRLNQSYDNPEWGIPDILKIEQVGNKEKGIPWVIKIHKSHCRLCNRFMIVASTKKMTPGVTKHNGGFQLVLSDGTLLYVYAQTTDIDSYGNPKDTFPNTTRDTTVIDYGFYASEINRKILKAIEIVGNMQPIMFSLELTDAEKFRVIPEFSGMESIRKDEESVISDNDMID